MTIHCDRENVQHKRQNHSIHSVNTCAHTIFHKHQLYHVRETVFACFSPLLVNIPAYLSSYDVQLNRFPRPRNFHTNSCLYFAPIWKTEEPTRRILNAYRPHFRFRSEHFRATLRLFQNDATAFFSCRSVVFLFMQRLFRFFAASERLFRASHFSFRSYQSDYLHISPSPIRSSQRPRRKITQGEWLIIHNFLYKAFHTKVRSARLYESITIR